MLVAGAVLAGCGTIRAAREAQARLAPIGAGERASAERVAPDFRNAPLRALVEYAQVHRPSMQSALLAVQDARLAMKEIAADAPLVSATPWNAASLSGSLGYSEASAAAHFDDLDHTRPGKATGSLSLELLVWDFGRNAAQAQAQAEAVVAAEAALLQEGYLVFDEVATAYFNLLRNDALLAVAQTNEQTYADHLQREEERLKVGEAMQLDVLRARLDLATARESLVSASNDVVTAGTALMAAMGIDAAAGTVETVLGPRPGGLDCLVRDFPDTLRPVGEAYAVGCTNAPALAVARARLRRASAQVDAAVADLGPNVKASLGLNWTDPLWYWNWGVSAVESLFTGFRRTTAVDRAVLAMETAANEVAREELVLSEALDQAVAERDTAREALAAARTRVRQAQENYATVAARYAVGEASRIDFSTAVSDRAEALGNRIRAFYRGQAAEAKLFRLLGEQPDYHEELTVEEMK